MEREPAMLGPGGSTGGMAQEREQGGMAGPKWMAPGRTKVTELNLEQSGFTEAEIARLRDLREMYPYIEYVDSRRQWHRLRFVKWLYLRGDIPQ